MEKPPGRRHPRLVPRRKPPEVVRIGHRTAWLSDLYIHILAMPWAPLTGCVVIFYMLSNLLFAGIYYANRDGIENAHSFADMFFFSVQTMATIGYGKMEPDTFLAEVMMSIEALTGLIGLAMVTGLVFAKFSRPSARVRFSKVAIVANRDGIPSLQFRMANMRANRIVDASARVIFGRQERTLEGEEMRRFYDLKLQRERNAMFIYSWTAIHPITEDSPISGLTVEAMEASRAEVIVSMIGLDETFAQTVHARHIYQPKEILWGHRFVDILQREDDGGLSIDYTHFDDVLPLP